MIKKPVHHCVTAFSNSSFSKFKLKLKITGLLVLGICSGPLMAQDMVITGVVDGPLTGGVPKAIEVFIVNDMPDLSVCGLGSANNGGGTDGEEFTFPNDGAAAGSFLYVASEVPQFNAFFGFDPDYAASAANINGDDAIELFCNGAVVDVFGDINGTGLPWRYSDGWAYRVNDTGPDGTTFNISSWTFSGPNALDGETSNSTALIPFPIGTYMRSGGNVETAPFVVSTDPSDGASGVAVDSSINIAFSEDVAVSNGWYSISCTNSFVHTATQSGGPQAFTLDVDSDFDNSETCSVTVTATLVSDLDNDDPPDNMEADHVFSFDTAAPAMPDSIIINEIMQNPSAVGDSNGEWFELFNSTDVAIDIDGWKLKDNGSNSHTINNGGPLVIAAGGFLVLGKNSDIGSNGGVQVDYEYSSFTLGNSDDEIILSDGSDAEVDRVEWDGGSQFPDPSGASMALIDPLLDNNVGGNWCEAASSYGDGDSGTPGQSNDCGFKPVINEIDYDQPGSDTAEFVEIKNRGTEAGDLSGLTLELINGGNASIYLSLVLPAVSLNPGEYFVVCSDAATVANCDLEALSAIQNGSPDAVALMASGVVVDTVSYEGDTAAPYTEGSGAGLTDSGSSGQHFKGISRLPDGQDSNRNNIDLAFSCISPGAANTSIASGCGPLGPVLEIFELQGNGSATPYPGQALGSNNNVVTTVSTNGFFIQTPTSRSDNDPDTSDGIFVFTGSVPTVSVGDLVDVNGTVVEFFDFTEINASSVLVLSAGNPLPAAVIFDENTPSPDPLTPSCSIEFECYEGMLVQITGGTVTGPNQSFGSDPLAEVHITAAGERTYREPGLEFPGLPGLPEWDGNPEVFELDPDKLGLPNQAIPAGSHFDAVGVIGYDFGDYELWPSALTVYPVALPPEIRDREDGEMTVAALNLFRLFDDIDDAPVPRVDPDTGIDYGPTDDAVLDSAEYVVRLTKFSGFIREVMKSPDILAVSEVESLKVLQDLASQIQADDASVIYTAYLEEGNDIGGIDVGFLTRDSIAVDGVTQLGRFELLSTDNSLLNDRPPLLLEGRQTADGSDFPISVMAIHGRSLSRIDSTRTQQKRYEQAQYVAVQIQVLQTGNPDINLVVTGDFNAHEFSDSYVDVTGQMKGSYVPADNLVCQSNSCDDLVEPDMINQVLMIPEGERYSFNFRGNAQVLDHALTSSALDELITDFSFARGNSDSAVVLIDDISTVLRSSDHDGVVVFLSKDSDGDGVTDDLDFCPGTVIPEGAAALGLGTNRWALVDDDRIFDTKAPKGKGPQLSFDIYDTAGCSCEQIIGVQQLGNGHFKYGCSGGEMQEWVDLVSQP